jgi:hypothetical protein
MWLTRVNTCYCQFYNFEEIKAETKFIECEDFFMKYFPNEPILDNADYCDKMIGFSFKGWTNNITPNAKLSKACYEDNNGRKGSNKDCN